MSSEIENIRETLRRFERELNIQNENCCNTGISLGQCHMVLDIEALNNTSVTELAEIQNLDKSTVSRSVDNLYKKDLINREINPDSRRQSIISLSDKGKHVCADINKINNEFFKCVFNDLDQEEFEIFAKVFKRVTNKMTDLRQSNKNCCT